LKTDDGEIHRRQQRRIGQLRPHSSVPSALRCGNAISQGKRKIKKIAVVADTEELTPPCGVCRQIIWEFGGDIPVIFANLDGKVETVQIERPPSSSVRH